MGIIPWLILIAICFVMLKSLIDFIRGGGKARLRIDMRQSRFSVGLFYMLLMIYITVIIGFGLIYFIMSFNGIILVEAGELREVSVFGSFIHSLYFSGVTMLTIGYGDITPIGIGRFIALIEALIGYILPAAFVLRLVQSQQERSRDK
ncbi:potassium channel LctB [Virgibacillus natechei]|uniref:Potassium channel LctB n=1 Tax=Virgibacillus natechei TaxID=1216297 RepID=A0ABS4IJQ9_9BACI|nr:potassium channel family protein [Virgibacillus natechei]MBP1970581.1 potassium channel LctB [Virgibacillus natechei]UZD14022.1 ion channel [Virgibacillus natechei]